MPTNRAVPNNVAATPVLIAITIARQVRNVIKYKLATFHLVRLGLPNRTKLK